MQAFIIAPRHISLTLVVIYTINNTDGIQHLYTLSLFDAAAPIHSRVVVIQRRGASAAAAVMQHERQQQRVVGLITRQTDCDRVLTLSLFFSLGCYICLATPPLSPRCPRVRQKWGRIYIRAKSANRKRDRNRLTSKKKFFLIYTCGIFIFCG